MANLNIDNMVYELVTSKDISQKHEIAVKIRKQAQKQGIYLASIYNLYKARSQNKFSGFTVPAINLRALTYDLARAIFRVGNRLASSAFILEIARSEMGYTDQSPTEYAAVCLAAALKENFKGPVFVQGDHFQVNAKKFANNDKKETEALKDVIFDSINAGFFNIDIDSSTLVDLDKSDKLEEQRLNFEICAQMSAFIREIEPKGITVSIGGEIGEVGKANSTPEELDAFMQGYNEAISKTNKLEGLAKISVQTGTSHGGVVLADGTVAKVKLDFDTLKILSRNARQKYGMAGAVQHGASTLPEDAFGKFPEVETAEVHLATQFQNMIYEHEAFGQGLRAKMYDWIGKNCAAEKKPEETDDQFIYKLRKKALGPFKKELMDLPVATRETIASSIQEKFEFLFKQLKIDNTRDLVAAFVLPVNIGISKELKRPAEVRHFEGDD
ncbi:MAG: class II fructose-bisphosphate aldolase [Candidatus Omnitrophica bacterium]|nr:class II fructose-bisphosphate aldolase [Candidatus Omnitrophota bacterium]